MSLAAGSRLGSYEVVCAIGAGGMGEVYRARDVKLNRDVAIKVLPDSLAGDSEHLARFQREAQVLASLNHPNIAHVYGLEGQDGGTRALVMELVEGPTLADRIAQGAMPIRDTLQVASQIIDALEAAHEQGIVHRDLKPANIKLRPDGAVKVLDFGLAKAVEPAIASGMNLTALPTITTPAMTRVGTVLGTASYMSPEQARGRAVDKRTDIWAFGCVLFEMVTGARPFDGEDVAEALGAVIHKDVPWSKLPTTTPATVRTVLERCLEKDPKQRIRDVGDARLALAGAFGAPSQIGGASVAPSARRAWTLAAVAAMVAAAIAGISAWLARVPPTPQPITFTVETPSVGDPDALALSPDGHQLAFVALDRDGAQRLWIRSLSSLAARVVPGTEFASSPCWSPDSSTVAFLAQGMLKSVSLSGGAPQIVARTATTIGRGCTWSERDEILFARYGTGIMRVSAAGGEPQAVVEYREDEAVGWPVFLPGGKKFLYFSSVAATALSEIRWRDLETKSEHVVRKVQSKAAYASGQLLFRLQGPLVAQRFDPSNGVATGDVVQVAPDVWSANGGQGRVAFSVSPAGVLACRAGQGSGALSQLTWIDRAGNVLSKTGSPGDYRNVMLDPTAEHIAVNLPDGGQDVWILDVKRGTTSRLTFDPATESDPVFSPDGKTVAFHSTRAPAGIYRKAASGAGPEELVAATGLQSWPRDWSSDGRFLLYMKLRDLWVVPMDGSRKPFPYLATPVSETEGRFSPDGRWVVYESDETGRPEIFVQDFPAKGAKFQVSTAGGSEPRWRRDGRELFYLGPDGRLMSVGVETTPELKLGMPTPLFQTTLMTLPVPAQRRFGVSTDGQRFVMNIPLQGSTIAPVAVTVNWQSVLKGK